MVEHIEHKQRRPHMGRGKAFIGQPTDIHTRAHPVPAFAAPKPISPPDGSIFSNFPRTTSLSWTPVPRAASYTVEIDCFQCCQVNQWCTDVGKTWQLVPGITATTFTFDFVGAQPVRWRVWAVGPRGRSGRKSNWSGFVYTV
jgi:hypothetical protein